MNRSIEQALTSLIPRHNGPLPGDLVDLASSLLSQSRNKAATLKADEEIGRTYACANIACERRQSLNLPPIEPRPPCPPRIYKKLYTYLDSTLTTRRLPRTTETRSRSSPARASPSKPVPGADKALAAFKTPAETPKHRQADEDTTIPAWIRPMIRAICAKLSVPAAAPHILAGVSTIIGAAAKPVTREGLYGKQDMLPALVAAVYFFVRMRLLGKATNSMEYIKLRKEVVVVLKDVRSEHDDADEAKWHGWEDFGVKDVDDWVKEISSRGFLQLDWFTNIIEGAGVALPFGEEMDAKDMEDDADWTWKQRDRDVHHGGLGTMLQERNDFLSARKREEYKSWEADILQRIEQIEAQSLAP